MRILNINLNTLSQSLKYFFLFFNSLFIRKDNNGNTYIIWFDGKKIMDD